MEGDQESGKKSPAEISMKSVPLSPEIQKGPLDDVDRSPQEEKLPVDTESQMKAVDREDSISGAAEKTLDKWGQKISSPTWKSVFGLIIFTLLVSLPSILIWLTFDYERYAFSETLTIPFSRLDRYREYERYVWFLAGSFILLVITEIIIHAIPSGILRSIENSSKRVKPWILSSVISIKYAAGSLSIAVWMFFIYQTSKRCLFQSSFSLAAQQAMNSLSTAEKRAARSVILGAELESILAALFVFTLCIAVEKYLMSFIHATFHRQSMAARINTCNSKFEIISILYNARQPKRATLSMTALTPAPLESSDDFELRTDKALDLSSVNRAKAIGKAIFKSVCPYNRSSITAADFRPYFVLGEHDKAFQIFDPDRKGQLDKKDFVSSVIAIYEERYKIGKALVENGRIIRSLDNVLFGVFALFGLLLAFVVYNTEAFSWVSGIGTFILGFSFLFQATVSKFFDTYMFVFATHAYDTTDCVVIDNVPYTIDRIDIITTHLTNREGLLIYSPNSNLKSKTIMNRQRVRLETDCLIFSTPDETSLSELPKVRSQLVSFLKENYNDFADQILVNIVGPTGAGKMRVKLEAKYNDSSKGDYRSDASIHERRAKLMQKFLSICNTENLTVDIESADQ